MILIADIREYLEAFNISTTQLSDAYIQRQIDAEIAKIERETGKSFFTVKTETLHLSGDGSKLLTLPRWPVVLINSITIKTAAGVGYPDTQLQDSDYILDGKNGQVTIRSTLLEGALRIFVFPEGFNNIEVSLDYGYTTAPPEVEDAITQSISANCLNYVGEQNGGALKSLSIEGYTETFDTANGIKYAGIIKNWKQNARNVLKFYRTVI